jgi:DNA-binding MltR family transcriptional regulator
MELGKVPPHDIEAEQAILGCMLTDRDSVISAIEVLKEDAFYREDNRAIYSAILSLYSKSEPIDIITVKAELIETGKFERIGGLESIIARLSAEKYADSVGLNVYDYVVKSDKEQAANITALFNETFKQIGDLKVAEQVNKMEIDKNFQLLNQKVDYENKLTACEINAVRTYVDATFMPVTKKISLCDICPIPQVATAVQPTLTCSSK